MLAADDFFVLLIRYCDFKLWCYFSVVIKVICWYHSVCIGCPRCYGRLVPLYIASRSERCMCPWEYCICNDLSYNRQEKSLVCGMKWTWIWNCCAFTLNMWNQVNQNLKYEIFIFLFADITINAIKNGSDS